MLESFFSALALIEDHLWSYIALPIFVLLGLYLSIVSKFVQIRKFPLVIKNFFSFLSRRDDQAMGVHPLKVFFACIGGCIGIGNIVAICSAIQIGGPGALLWIWATALIGMVLKYSEVFLGMRFRVTNKEGGYSGGPMYFLQRVFKSKLVPYFACLLLCVYGVEVYQFSVMANSISVNLDVNPFIVSGILLVLVVLAVNGGVNRVGQISTLIMPICIVCYLAMGLWVLFQNLSLIPSLIGVVFTSAFTGHAAVGGFAGSGIMLALSHGIRRGCYTGDVGIGYASIIHSESSSKIPEKQASLAIFDVFVDTMLICTTSIALILVTGVWKEPIHESLLVQTALSQYFPYMNYFMPFFLFLLGYSTIISYFCIGLKSAQFLSPKKGKGLFYTLATLALGLFSLVSTEYAMSVMAITGALLLTINLYGMFILRKEISFDFSEPKTDSLGAAESLFDICDQDALLL